MQYQSKDTNFLDWRDDERKPPAAVLLLDVEAIDWIAQYLPDGDVLTKELKSLSLRLAPTEEASL